MRKTNRKKLQNSFKVPKTYTKFFGGATVQDLHHYILPSIMKDKPDIVAKHIESNNIKFNEDIDAQQLANSIIDIGKIYKSQGIKDILISSILIKQCIKLGKIIAKVNGFLSSLSTEKDFYFLSHQDISRKHLSHDGVHLSAFVC